MHSTLEQWLKELEAESELVHSKDINEEANSNLVGFGVSENLFNEWGNSSIETFLRKCAELYNSKNDKAPMIFYSWFDEMAGQIRISAVSKSHGRLPFRCDITVVELSEMIKSISAEIPELFELPTLKVWQSGI